MPPHCDSLDGPVVTAAKKALEAGNVDIVLPYVPKDGEVEVRRLFEKTMQVRSDDTVAREIAEMYFFETVVRIHRAGEGAPYTGLKPAGLDVGPVIPAAERAIETGSPNELLDLLCSIVRQETLHKFEYMQHLKLEAGMDVDHTREYVEAMLGLQVWSHQLYTCARTDPHMTHHVHD